MTPGGAWRSRMPSRARRVKGRCHCFRSAPSPPRVARRSRMLARNTLPPSTGNAVTSVTHTSLGRVATKSLLSRFAATHSVKRLSVVTRKARRGRDQRGGGRGGSGRGEGQVRQAHLLVGGELAEGTPS